MPVHFRLSTNLLQLLVNGVFKTGFWKKADIFNAYFVNQCNNGSVIPEVSYKTNKRAKNVTFSSSDLSEIIKNLNPNKAHGYDNISIKMIQVAIQLSSYH